MSLPPGTRLGPYEISAPIGEGGMGEVYRARDTRLDRTVAIKVLSDALASDPQSRERFEREAKAVSSLNHPNICVLHDVGRDRVHGADGADRSVDFLVMEYLEGETLAARLARSSKRGPGAVPSGLPIPEALGIAIQIASALDRAHRQAIVHRDLKPGNVMLVRNTAGGSATPTVKLLDFGLARLVRTGAAADGADGIGQGTVSLTNLSMPTVTSPLTMKGTLLGTLQYMAPEQLEGKDVDARTDIFAFGGVLHEMLTGARAFEGRSQASLIGAILDQQPRPVTSLRSEVPALVEDIVTRCLAKDPDDRWQTARDLMRPLEWVARDVSSSPTSRGPAATTPVPGPRRGWLPMVATAVAVALLTAGLVAWRLWPRPSVPPAITRLTVDVPQDQAFTRTGRHMIALSSDGTRLIYVANRQLYLRPLAGLSATPIAGTEESDPSEPVFSPDGQWVAFWSSGVLKKIPVAGGTPVSLATVRNPFGVSWTGDRILLGMDQPRGIVEVPASGGVPQTLVSFDAGKEEQPQSPQLVDDGRAVLFTLRTGTGAWSGAAIVVQDLATGQRTVLVEGGTDARVVQGGYLVYGRGTMLLAVPFDMSRRAATGTPVPIEQRAQEATGGFSGAVQATFSASGTFAFVYSDVGSAMRELAWYTRDGRGERAPLPARPYWPAGAGLRISPDGTRVALRIIGPSRTEAGSNTSVGTGSDVWIWDIAKNTLTRLTFTGAATDPVWTPDGTRVCYDSDDTVYCQAADGRGQPDAILSEPLLVSIRSISPDGANMILATTLGQTGTRGDIIMSASTSGSKATPLIQSSADDRSAIVSPDGRWIAYESDESGRDEVYVRPFPAVQDGLWQISTTGGTEPRWSRDGRELFFIAPASAGATSALVLMAMPVARGLAFTVAAPVPLFRLPQSSMAGAYDVAPDKRFLVTVGANSSESGTSPSPRIVVVQHWAAELKSR